MMNNADARLAINDHIRAFTGIDQNKIQWPNQLEFKPPKQDNWCRVTVQYAPSVEAGLSDGSLERDYGIINIQCFTPVGFGDKDIINLTDKWRTHWKGFKSTFLEVYRTNAPTNVSSEVNSLYAMSLVRIEFRVN